MISKLFVITLLVCFISCKGILRQTRSNDKCHNVLNDSIIRKKLEQLNFSMYVNGALKNYVLDDSLPKLSYTYDVDDMVYNKVAFNYSERIKVIFSLKNSTIRMLDKNQKLYYPKTAEEFYSFEIFSISIYQDKKLIFSTNPKLWDLDKIQWLD